MIIPPHPLTYCAPKLEDAFVFTGDLSKGQWADAEWSEVFQDIEGDKKPKPEHKTRMKIMWDEDCLYVGAELIEPHVWATLTKHDSVIFHDNDFEVFLDPDGDNHDYFEYEINAFGTDWDLRLPKPYRDGGPALNSWEIPGMKKKVTVCGTVNDPSDVDEKWVVEMAFPWSAFAEHAGVVCPPKAEAIWRINFSRVEWDTTIEDGKYVKVPGRPEHNWVWSPQGVIDMHRPEMWGYVKFMKPGQKAARFSDPVHKERHQLMAIYWAQRSSISKDKKWLTAEELGDLAKGVDVVLSKTGWTATIETPEYVVSIRRDSKLTVKRR